MKTLGSFFSERRLPPSLSLLERDTGRMKLSMWLWYFQRYCLVTFVVNLASTPIAAAPKKNVLLIISDDLSAEALSCYGNQQCQTPAIDRLATQGLRFERAYCQFPVCGPSRAALMSGMYPQTIGVRGNGSSSRFTENLGERPSFAQHFRNHDYFTARVSKIYHMRVPGDITNGVDGPDHIASWSQRFNCQAPEWMTRGQHFHLSNERLKRDPNQHYGLGFGSAFYVVKGETNGAEQPDVMAADKAIELLNNIGDAPFFLAVGFVRPHVPLVAPASFHEPYPTAKMRLPQRKLDDWDDIPKAGRSRNSTGMGLAESEEKQRQVISAYYASVTFMDRQVGRIISALDQAGLRDDTIVVFTSDHGYHLGEHDFWQKMSLHEESVRIPVIISAPEKTVATTASLFEQIDLFPTLAELCNLPVPEHCQGRSAASLFDHPKQPLRTQVYCLKGKAHLLRTDRWAYIEYPDKSCELYDMHADPQQFSNLASVERHAESLTKMQRRLRNKLRSIQSHSY